MAYDARLAERLATELGQHTPYEERSMFGGICYMVNGKMAIGVSKDDVMVRVGPDTHDKAVKQTGARPMDFTGRPMKGFVFVSPDGTKKATDLRRWITMALAYNAIAPVAKKKTRKKA
jgi:TfoX/Sxy family transcriptional regulator of competence genes